MLHTFGLINELLKNNIKQIKSLKNSNNNKIDAAESDYLYKSPSQIPNSGKGLFTAIDIYKNENNA